LMTFKNFGMSLNTPAGTRGLAQGVGPMGSELGPGKECPRCHLPIDFLERRKTRTGQVYYIAWHYIRGPDGTRKVKKCYLGPRTYRHGQVTHEPMGVELHGMVVDLGDTSRYADYLMNMAKNLQDKMEHHALPSIHARAIVKAIEELAGLIEPMRQYIEEKAREEEELAKARAEGGGHDTQA